MIHPSTDVVLTAVISAVERDIAPTVTDDYAASLCRTAAQMLRSVRARVALEQEALDEDNAELRELLASVRPALPPDVHADVDRAVAQAPPARYPALTEQQDDALRLRGALSAVVAAVPDGADPIRTATRDYLRRQLGRERAWQQDAFTGPRR